MWRFYWAIVRGVPALLWVAANRWKSIVVIIVFLLTLFNGPLGGKLIASWQAISPWWAFVPVGTLLVYGLMKSNYERYCQLGLTLNEKAAKAQQECSNLQEKHASLAKENSNLKLALADLEKPKRTPLEEKNHQTLKSCLEKYGEEEKTVLRHLAMHGKMAHHVGWDISPPVRGFTHDRTVAILNKLLADRMVTPEGRTVPGGWETIWRISPGAMSTLNELL